MTAEMIRKMIDFYAGSVHDIEHFLKVYAYAQLIGRLEGLDQQTQNTLELAAIVHDIACPLCRAKYGHADGFRQEEESEALLRPFLAEFSLPGEVRERIIYLVTHHHTLTDIQGADYQILVEADFLVNAAEAHLSREAIVRFRDEIAKTEAAKHLLQSIYLG